MKFIWGMRRGAEKGVDAEKEGTEKDREERERRESVERRVKTKREGGRERDRFVDLKKFFFCFV